METGELLRNVRLIVREEVRDEITALNEKMDARFDHVYALFDGVFGKLDRLDTEMVALKGGLARLEARLNDVENRLTSVESRLSSVESELQFVKNEIGRFERWRASVEARFDASEQNAARDAKIAEINEQIEAMNARITALETRH